jgi:hypothetical protein
LERGTAVLYQSEKQKYHFENSGAAPPGANRSANFFFHSTIDGKHEGRHSADVSADDRVIF